MNVIRINGPYRSRKKPNQKPAKVYREKEERERREDKWHSFLEVLLFGLIAIAATWPLFAAGEAVLRCL
jgi:hypothetical protein